MRKLSIETIWQPLVAIFVTLLLAGVVVSQEPETVVEDEDDDEVLDLKPGERALPGENVNAAILDPIIRPMPRDPSAKEGDITTITAETSTFDATTNVVTFENFVKMINPTKELTMTCQVLRVEMLDGEDKAAAGENASGIKLALASGKVVIETVNAKGDIVTAMAQQARFDMVKQKVILSDYPKIQDSGQRVDAIDPDTQIILTNDGKFWADGKATTTIINNGMGAFKLPKP